MAFALLSKSRGSPQPAHKLMKRCKTAPGPRATGFERVPDRRGAETQVIQAKLKVSDPNDSFEQEADRAADEVMRMPDRAVAGSCSGCGNQAQRSVQSAGTQHAPIVTPDFESRMSALRGGGQPLSQSLRAFFEPRFGCDFSQVRLHSGAQAADAANAVNARAFTVGTDLVFAQGQPSLSTGEGKKLLAHELTHVLQQSGGRTAPSSNHITASRSPATVQRFSEKECLKTICGLNQCQQIEASLSLARQYVETAISAMEERVLSSRTREAMRWLFDLDDDSQNAYILNMLKTINEALTRADNTTDVQCEKTCYPPGAGAYVRTPETKTAGTLQQCTVDTPCTINICDSFGGLSGPEKAIALIHEAGHLAGMSGDVYRRKPRFRLMSQSEALGNAEHFALFVRALNGVLKSDLRLSLGAAGGVALAGGNAGWFLSSMLDLTLNRPAFRIFNPVLRLSITGYGVEGSGRDERMEKPNNRVLVESLLAGVHIGSSRGPGGWFGDLLIGGGRAERGGEARYVFTASASLGYRWDRKEVAIGASYIRDTTAVEGFQNLFLVGASANFNLLDLIKK